MLVVFPTVVAFTAMAAEPSAVANARLVEGAGYDVPVGGEALGQTAGSLGCAIGDEDRLDACVERGPHQTIRSTLQ